MSHFLRLVLVVSLILSPLATLLPVRTAYALDSEKVTQVVTALQSLGTVVNSLSNVAGLGEPIPFTEIDPSEALNLDTLFSGALDALGALGASSSLVALAEELEHKGNLDLGDTDPDIAVEFNNVVGNDTDNTLVFDFVATRTMTVPLTFAQGDVNLDGSEIALTFSLAAPFAFGYDSSASNVNEKVFLTNEPTIAVTAEANVPNIIDFENLLGFTSVSVSGSLLLNMTINAALKDPDSNGRLTLDEWSSTALGDLVRVAFADGPGDDINGNLKLDASIVPGAPDASVVWVDASLADGPGTPTVTLNNLTDFTNINASDIFRGLASATTALLSAQQSGDLQLPFLQESLSDLFHFADPLVKFVHEMGDAAVVCGPNKDTMPPTGPIFGLAEHVPVYCQAFTISPVEAVNWKVGTLSINAELSTVGPNPSATVQLDSPGDLDNLSVEFHIVGEVDKHDNPVTRLSRPLFLTADELTAKLRSIADIDTVETNYDATKKILTYHMQESLPEVSKKVETDFADQLKVKTGMFGLNPSGSDIITATISDIKLDVTFGVILVPDPIAIKAGGTDADRFFLQVGAGNEFQANVAVAAGSQFGLAGRLAFLEVTAGGVTSAGNPGEAIFALNPSDDAPAAPSLAVNIAAPGLPGVSLPGGPIPNAVLVSDLLSGTIGSKITAQCELGLSAGLEAKATNVTKAGGGSELVSGKVAISWPDVFQDGTCIPDFDGIYDGPDRDKGVVIEPDGQFSTDLFSFDIDTDNPVAMLSIILNSIAGLAGAIDALPGLGDQADLGVQIPVVGVSPRELLDKLEEINTVMNKATADPADTLAELETWLEGPDGLDIDPSLLSFELGDVGPDTEKDLILRLDYSKEGNITRPLNFDVKDGGINFDVKDGGMGLVSVSSDGDTTLTYTVGAQFDVAIPLKPSSALANTLVLETTRATVDASLAIDNLGFIAAVGPLEVGVTGQTALDVDVVVENLSTENLSFDTWLAGVGVDLKGDEVNCGEVDVNPDPAITENKALSGQACALLALNVGSVGVPVGMLGFRAQDITAEPTGLDLYEDTGSDWFVYIPDDITTQIDTNVLNWGYLFQVLPELTDKLAGILEAGSEDVSVPGLGETLDAGAGVVKALEDSVIEPLSGIAAAVTGTTAGDVETEIRTEVKKIPILKPYTENGAIDNVAIETYCGDLKCADGASVSLIDDVRVTFKVGQAIDAQPEFDIGIDGLPIKASGAMSAVGDWSLLIDVGLNRTEGPYIDSNAPEPELNLTAFVGLADNPNGCKANPRDGTYFPQPAQYPESNFSNFSTTRCLQGQLAFLAVGLHDGDNPNDNVGTDDKGNDRTKISLTTTLDLKSDAASGHLTVGNIINSVGLHPRFQATANIDLALRTSIELSEPFDGLPGVVGAFHLDWDNKNMGAPDVKFDSLYMQYRKSRYKFS